MQVEELKAHIKLRSQLFDLLTNHPSFADQLHQAGSLLQRVVHSGSTVLICGNGGSAAEAQHMAGEIVGRFMVERDGYAAIALNADTAILTAIGNDYGYNAVFARQVTAYKERAKLLILISTSGNSPNLIQAALQAKIHQITTVGLLGRDGGALAPLCDFPIIVPSESTPQIQEAHLAIIHLLCEYVDTTLK